MSKVKKIRSNISKIILILRRTEINIRALILGAILAVILVILNFFLLALLFPIVNLILNQDLSIVDDIKYINKIIYFFNFQHSFWGTLLFLSSFLYLTTILKSTIKYLSFLCVNVQAKTASIKIRNIIFKRYLSFGKLFFDNKNSNELNRVLLESSGTINQGIDNINKITIDILTSIVYFSFLFFISWKLTVIAIPPLIFLYFFSNNFKKKIRELNLQRENTQKDFLNKISEIISCIVLVKGFGKEKKEEEEFKIESEKEINLNIQIQKKIQILSPIEEIVSTSVIIFIAGVIAIVSLYEKNFAISNIMVFMFILYRIPGQIYSIQSKQTVLIQIETRLKNIEEILDDQDKYIFEGGNKIFHNLKDKIEFKKLNFGYSDIDVLHDVSFEIKKGEKIAIIGKMGSGKTTIANILLRFYDCPEGSVFIDGEDIRKYSLDSLKKHFAFVTQNAILFNDTIRANVLYANPKVAQEQFENIIKKTDLYEITEKFGEKMEYVIGEKGSKLSGGEKQRISIARALIKDASIIILDEPTNSMDTKTEKNMNTIIQEVWKDKTVVIIAHRISTIMHADKVIVLEDGKIVEMGSPDELVAKKGYFYSYYKA